MFATSEQAERKSVVPASENTDNVSMSDVRWRISVGDATPAVVRRLLAELAGLWPDNPCLIMVKPLGAGG